MYQLKNTAKISVLLVSIFLISGCGVVNTLVEKQIEKEVGNALGKNTQVDINNNEIKIKTENGINLQTGDNIKLPDDFPKDVYVIEGELKVAMKNTSNAGYNLSVLSPKSVVEVKKIYEEQLKVSGWNISLNTSVGEMAMLSSQKDIRNLVVTVSKDQLTTKTAVVIMLTEKVK